MTIFYRANFGDGTHSQAYADIRDARAAKWARAAIVQYRTSIEQATGDLTQGTQYWQWTVIEPSRASLNGPVIGEVR
jgi:hypothetical protein